MEERRVRPSAGRKGDGTIHRVGLTRHCLTSGSIQLPFALRDALPEGEIMVLDVDRGETFSLVSQPPRRLSGLRDFFATHELRVNDLLEIRAAEAELRLACVRSARSSRDAERERDRAGSEAHAVTAPAPVESGPRRNEPVTGRPVRSDPPVVERIGSVTVRRLGAAAFAPPPESTPSEHALRRRGAAADDANSPLADTPVVEEGLAEAVVESREPRDAAEVSARSEAASDSRAADLRPTGLVAASASAAPITPHERSAQAVAAPPPAGPDRSRPAPRGGTRRAEARHPTAGDVHESDLADDGPVASSPPWSVRLATERASFQRAERAAAPSRGRPPSTSVSGAAVEERDRPTHAPASGEAIRPGARSEREEALSRAGDLRSRIVRWLLDPATPVIVQYEAVQGRFDLSAEVARDVLAGILESPPPSLKLTVLREGMIRVSRVTVVQED